MGIANPRVFPDPVFDRASVSRPDVASSITMTWIGNGDSIPRAARARTTSSETPRSRNVVILHRAYRPRWAPQSCRYSLGSPRTRDGRRNEMTDTSGTDTRPQLWNDLAAQLGVDSIRSTTQAGSGHPTSSLSAAHLTAVLFSDHLRTDLTDPHSPGNDRFVLSKGHAAPLLYAALKAIGAIDDELMLTLRRFGSPIQGHPAPVPELPWVEAATGSLGQGPAIGLGMALAMRLDESPARVWVLIGDSEAAEGSVWEAMEAASHHEAANLTCVLDLNRLGQRGPTMHGWDADIFVTRAETFGWRALALDGHDVAAIDEAYRSATEDDRPTMIVARTEKGHGVSEAAAQEGWPGKAFPP